MDVNKFTIQEITEAWQAYNAPLIILPQNDGKVNVDDVIRITGKGDFIHFLILRRKKKWLFNKDKGEINEIA